jgi:hypothetical protein
MSRQPIFNAHIAVPFAIDRSFPAGIVQRLGDAITQHADGAVELLHASVDNWRDAIPGRLRCVCASTMSKPLSGRAPACRLQRNCSRNLQASVSPASHLRRYIGRIVSLKRSTSAGSPLRSSTVRTYDASISCESGFFAQ